MLERIGEAFRKFSLILIPIAILIAFWTEAFSDVPIGRGGRLKAPIGEQRRNYLLLFAAGIPGSAWALWRAAKGRQRTFWE